MITGKIWYWNASVGNHCKVYVTYRNTGIMCTVGANVMMQNGENWKLKCVTGLHMWMVVYVYVCESMIIFVGAVSG